MILEILRTQVTASVTSRQTHAIPFAVVTQTVMQSPVSGRMMIHKMMYASATGLATMSQFGA
jgi:uncharacterized membrane protein